MHSLPSTGFSLRYNPIPALLVWANTKIGYVWICIFSNWFPKKYPGRVPFITKAAALARGLSSSPMGCQLSLLKAVHEIPVLGFSLHGGPLCSATTLHLPHCHILQQLPQAQACCRDCQSSQQPTEDKRGDLPYASECLAQIPAPCRDGVFLGPQCVPCIEYSYWPVIDNQYSINERTGVWDEVGSGRKWGRGRKIEKREWKK